MGGSSSRPQTYEQYYESLSRAPNETIDPYYVLELRKDYEWDELVAAYRRLARIEHPDKGTVQEKQVRERMFQIATQAFRD